MCHCEPSFRHCEHSEAISHLNILSLPVHSLSLNDVISLVKDAIAQRRPLKITTINSIIAVMAQRNPDLRKAVMESDIMVPDSVGIVWAGKMLGHCNLKRLTGIDLARELLCHAESNNWRVFLLGAKPGVAELASKNLNKIYPRLNIVGVHHGYFENAEEKLVVEKISVCAPDLLLVGIGSPRQEIWINKFVGKSQKGVPSPLGVEDTLFSPLPMGQEAKHSRALVEGGGEGKNLNTVAMGVGGTLDVFAGTVRRAPGWMQKYGLEWLFRLILEPHRFWRIILYLPLFVILVFLDVINSHSKK